jgi:hypothetical protein
MPTEYGGAQRAEAASVALTDAVDDFQTLDEQASGPNRSAPPER